MKKIATGCWMMLLPVLMQAQPSGMPRAHGGTSLRFIDNIEVIPATGEITQVTSSGSTSFSENSAAARTPVKVNQVANGSIENCTAIQFKYALLLDMEVEQLSNFPLLKFMEDWWGTRYKYGGNDRSGIDCSAFCGRLFQDVYSVELPRTAREQYAALPHVTREELAEGDLVFFNTRGGVSHVGMYLGNNRFVHSSTNSGVTISSLEDDYYNKRFVGAARVAR